MSAALLMAAMLAQAPGADPTDAAQLERIRKAAAEPPAISIPASVPRDGYVFRVTVHAPAPARMMWDDWSSVPSYIRPNMGLYHYEFLEQVTPEEYRAGTLYSAGIPIGALIMQLARHWSQARHNAKEERARDEVRQALAEVLACRADPTGPGC